MPHTAAASGEVPALCPVVPPVWTLVLAAGVGRRVTSLTRGVPKQFWRHKGESSLLDRTLERFDGIAGRSRTVVVVAAEHRAHAEATSALEGRHVVYQSRDRGTAAGVALGLLPVLETDPDAIVILTPSDHGVSNRSVFQDGLRAAVRHVDQHDDIVLCGVEARGPSDDYGWIVPCPQSGASAFRPVMAFYEKPDRIVASALYSAGAVWNTMITVARARTVFAVFRQQAPDLAGVFVRALRMPAAERPEWLANAYEWLTPVDFSQDVIATTEGLTAYVWPRSVGWTDLGTPSRLLQWMRSERPGRPQAAGAAGQPHQGAPERDTRSTDAPTPLPV